MFRTEARARFMNERQCTKRGCKTGRQKEREEVRKQDVRRIEGAAAEGKVNDAGGEGACRK
jgi:hypothetical protein